MSNQQDNENGWNTSYAGDSPSADQDSETVNESQPNPPSSSDEMDVMEPAVSDLQAVAEQFNNAFNTALYELESSRKLARERAARIDELNDSIRSINNSLEEETGKRHQQEAEFARETDQLKQRIHELESEREQLNRKIHELESGREQQNHRINEIEAEREQLNRRIQEIEAERERQNGKINEIEAERDRLQQQTIEQEAALHAGAEETSQLSLRVEELSGSLAEHIAKGLQTEEEFTREKETLVGNLHELQEKHENICGQLDTQKRETEELSQQYKSEIESQQSANEKLAAHVEKLQDLSRALHDSRISESEMHNKLLEERDREIEALRARTDAGNAMAVDMASAVDETENLKTALLDLESRLATSESERETLGEKAGEVDKLEATIAQLNAALHEARESSQQDTADAPDLQAIHTKVTDLETALQSARDERDVIAGKLNDQQALEQEVNSLREALEQSGNTQHEQAEDHANVDSLKNEIELLKTTLETTSSERDALAGKLHEQQALEQEVNSLREAAKQSDNMRLEQVADFSSAASLNDEIELLKTTLETISSERDVLAGKLHEQQALEQEVNSLREALEQSGNSQHEQAEDHANVDSLKNEIELLKTTLETTSSERDALAGKLHEQQALEQEVNSLRETLEQSGNSQHEQAEDHANVDSLKNEIEALKVALANAEEKCAQQQAALDENSVPDDTGSTVVTTPAPASVPVAGMTERSHFITSLNGLLSEPGNAEKDQSVMYVLIDNFVRIRDEIGIMNSEQVIDGVAEIIASHCNDNDSITRFGDCTFAVLCDGTNTEETRDKAEKIRSAVQCHIFEIAGHSVITSTSIGVCSVRAKDDSAEAIIARADLACESARTSGGNQVLVSSTVADDIGTHGYNENFAHIVSKILDDNRIKIYYQSISSLSDEESNCYEVLTRIVDEDGNIILPGEFFSMAINSGKAIDVDYYVIDNIVRMMSENADQPMKLFIKLTRQSVASQDFTVWVMEKIKEYRVNPAQLVFEVSEGMLVNELKNLSIMSKALNAIGCKVAIEHYRMTTQPQHLQHIQADYLKIDSGLVQNIGSKGKCFSKVTEIMDLARRHNFITIAEGVESPACLSILWELGINFAQGYFIQAPSGQMDLEDNNSDEDEDDNKASYSLGLG